MRLINHENFFANKFTHLLTVLVISFLLSPFLGRADTTFPIISLIFLIAIVLTLRALDLPKNIFLFCFLLAACAFALDLIIALKLSVLFKEALSFISLIIYALFITIAIIAIIKKLFKIKQVTTDTIVGGICIYVLIGFLWTLFYGITLYFDPSGFSFDAIKDPMSMFYFSFTTLTTLGFGDLVPLNHFARVLASLESIVGPVYLAIFIARLVGLHVIEELKTKQEDEK